MRRGVIGIALTAACLLVSGAVILRAHVNPQTRGSWTIPDEAAAEKNPLTVNEGVLAAGRKLYVAKCQRCHGAEAKGDGPDADSSAAARMDLRLVSRAKLNPDGVVFHKIWNGRLKPKMPAFSEELSREQTWALVAYVQSLRTVK